ncbi:MAG: GFA family protein [Gammaproteobacteria bacterium]|nr:GFA family protein [Gammaproteobacteria bacterium]MYF00076.1 GFA family protein [Gammaproteobacteria bacterium]MYG96583.1 GFA family protein [Gammaproteobacteria bacterium]
MLERTGGCLCGGVRYRVVGSLRPIIYCHCGQCRRTSGHFVAATAADADTLEIVADESLAWFASSERAQRGFCRRCGSSLFWRPEDGSHVSIMAGTLDNSNGLAPVEHIYVGAKGEYYELTDDLPKRQGRT